MTEKKYVFIMLQRSQVLTNKIKNYYNISFYEARKLVNPAIGLQGNLDPRILFASEEIIQQKLESYRPYWEEHHNWILNLGHGVPPQAPLKSLQFITNYVKRSW